MRSVNCYNRLGDNAYSDRFENTVYLSQYSEDHIRKSHEEERNYEEIASTLIKPDLLVKSTKHPRSVEYYRLGDSNWHKVVVKKTPDGLYVATSHYARRLSKGEWLWRNPDYTPTPKDLERNSGTEPPSDSPKIWPDGIALE